VRDPTTYESSRRNPTTIADAMTNPLALSGETPSVPLKFLKGFACFVGLDDFEPVMLANCVKASPVPVSCTAPGEADA
jgi:hypothetical protein